MRISPLSASGSAAWMAGVSVLALAVAGAANAQSTGGATEAKAVEEVVVTGTHVVRAGFEAPTPVTVITPTELGAAPLLSDALMKMPQLAHTVGPTQQTNGLNAGHAFLNLRNLGSARTLVLLDGRRFVSTSNGGTVDVGLMPSQLVQRVDIVTGGASAAYGSDAVAGVVNFILDTKFTGVKAAAEYGVSTLGDDVSRRVDLSGGASFAGGRGHILASGEYSKSDGLTQQDRGWLNSPSVFGVVPNPGAGPTNIHITDPRHLDSYTGGIVTSGPLKGLIFGPGGVPGQLSYGTQQGSVWMSGGSGDKGNLGTGVALGTPLKRGILFGRVSYDLTDKLEIFAEANWADARAVYGDGKSNSIGGTLAPTIKNDNPFLPASVLAQMTAAKLTSFQLPETFGDLPFSIDSKTVTKRGVVGLNGSAGKWRLNAYYTYGETTSDVILRGIVNQLTLYPAMDAVRNSAGQIVCRSTLNGCIPFNPLGTGVNSQAALNYVTGDELTTAKTTQNAAAVTISGDVFDLWAGPLSAAGGVEWRRETFQLDSDPIAQAFNPTTRIIGGWRSGNSQPVSGSNSVKEVFAEIVAPLVRDAPLAKSLELNAAVRYTDYSYSGGVTTWKVGLNYQPVADLRFRLTRSRDIRAPNLGELFNNVNNANASVTDRFKKVTISGVKVFQIGNTGLVPEVADTLAYGAVYQPGWAPRLQLSADVWDIKIQQAITTLTPQQVMDQCFGGATSLCQYLTWDPPRDPAGNLTAINTVPFNLAVRHMSGVDLEGAYGVAVGPGNLTFRALATYLRQDKQTTPGLAPIDRAGDIGQSGEPKWVGSVSANYTLDAFTGFLTVRYIGSGNYDNTLVPGVTIDYNKIPSTTYVDGRISYDLSKSGGKYQAYLAVNNLLDRKPTLTGSLGNGSTPTYTDLSLFDPVGRFFRLGFTARY